MNYACKLPMKHGLQPQNTVVMALAVDSIHVRSEIRNKAKIGQFNPLDQQCFL